MTDTTETIKTTGTVFRGEGYMAPEEFRSRLEEIMPAEELLFDPTPAFGKYKAIMPEEAVQHPAKFNTNLVEFLIKKYTKHGDVVLDPMAGSGVLGVIAALHGRHAIQVEIEEKFFSWMEKARENVEKIPSLTPKGKIVNICGDARRLSELLSRVDIDAIITSPPYSSQWGVADKNRPKATFEREKRYRENHPELKGKRPPLPGAYSDSMENIGNLPLGNIDVIITSPPYADVKKGGEADEDKMAERWDKAFREKGEKWNSWGKTWTTEGRKRALKALGSGYSVSEDNIGNLPLGYVDTIITSPPYEGSLEGTSRHTCGGIASRDPALAQTGTYATVLSEATKKGVPVCYSPNPNNIGNLKSSDEEYEMLGKRLMKDGKPTYLSEMLKVYREMWKVLKPDGYAIIVIKPFIRNKKVVDLPYHTFQLLSMAGFRLEKLYKLRLKQQSFWRILLYKKHPEVPRINHEYVLVCRKSVDTAGNSFSR